MNDEGSGLYRKIGKSPIFLFLGQKYLSLESGQDSFLSEIQKKYSIGQLHGPSYRDILDKIPPEARESALAWMQEKSKRITVPDWLRTIVAFPWNAVYSSAFDSVWYNAFRNQVREVQPIFEEKYVPQNPRSRTILHCTFLFGSIDRTEQAERPPLTKLEWLKRRQTAVALLRRITEDLTPFGLLFIEGLSAKEDWLGIDDILPVLDELLPGQAHIFSSTEDLEHDGLVEGLVANGKIVMHRESLTAFLLHGEEAGYIRIPRIEEVEAFSRTIQIADSTIVIPNALWNQTSTAATIIDDSMLEPRPPLSDDARYSDFRNFLAEADARATLMGCQRGYVFRRDYYESLKKEVDATLATTGLHNRPIILHGQTGTGKTLALSLLACEIALEENVPVLFIERKSQKPIFSVIDTFCQWAENSGASNCLIVWDGMRDLDQYYEFVNYLISRGRKIVLVGSSYKQERFNEKLGVFTEAPAVLAHEEVIRFFEFLNGFDQTLGSYIKSKVEDYDSSFLVAIYRLLPTSRYRLSTGVIKEVGYAEDEIKRKAKEFIPDFEFGHALADALYRAGLINEEHIVPLKKIEIGDELFSVVEQLVGMIMVPGQFGLRVPLELLIRSLKRESILNFPSLISSIDIFRWDEDPLSNLTIRTRHPLEAQIFVQARLGGARTEIEFIKKLIMALRPSLSSKDNAEVEFIIDLIEEIGPKGRKLDYYAPFFDEISSTLGALRETRGVMNPRLVLKEANLLREWITWQDRKGIDVEDIGGKLKKKKEILNHALELVKDERAKKELSSQILTEAASITGSEIIQKIKAGEKLTDILPDFIAARDMLMRARLLQPGNYYAFDVLAWISIHLIESNLLDPLTQTEVTANILHAVETEDVESTEIIESSRYNERKLKIASLCKDQKVSDDAFAALAAQGSTAGYYIRAQNIVANIEYGRELSKSDRTAYMEAFHYLEMHKALLINDGRCNYMKLRLWWMSKTGKPIIAEERQTVAFSQEDWQFASILTTDLLQSDNLHNTPLIKYLAGIISFQLGLIDQSITTFNELQRESELVRGSRRIVRHYLVSDSSGMPKKYNGTVSWVSENNRGEIFVEELRRKITFLPFDFGRPEIQKNDAISNFHIGFNFLGPVADPPKYHEQQRKLAK